MCLMIIDYFKVRPGTPLFCSGILTGMSFYIPNPIYGDFEEEMNHGIFFMFLNIRMDSQKNWISKVSNKIKGPMKKAKAKSIYRGYNQKSSSQKNFPFVFPLIILLQTSVCML